MSNLIDQLKQLKQRQQKSQPTAPLEEPVATHDIEKNLAVNPPPVAGTAAVDPVVEEGAPVAITPEGTPCPTCGKVFKHLSRHRCKHADAPKAPVASAITFPTDAQLSVMLPALQGPALDAYAKGYGVTRANPGDDPKFRETIKRLITRDRDGVVEEQPYIEPEVLKAEDPQPVTSAGIDTTIHSAPGTDVKEVGEKAFDTEKALNEVIKKHHEKADPKKQPKEDPCFDLIVGCEIIQTGMNVIYFYEIVAILEQKILEAAGMHWAEIEYGKGKAALCECLDMLIQDGEFNSSTIVVTNRTQVYMIVADLLRQYSRNVIVGV